MLGSWKKMNKNEVKTILASRQIIWDIYEIIRNRQVVSIKKDQDGQYENLNS